MREIENMIVCYQWQRQYIIYLHTLGRVIKDSLFNGQIDETYFNVPRIISLQKQPSSLYCLLGTFFFYLLNNEINETWTGMTSVGYFEPPTNILHDIKKLLLISSIPHVSERFLRNINDDKRKWNARVS